MVGKKTLGEAVKTFQNAGIHRTQRVGYSPRSSVGNNLKALLALLLLVLIPGHLGGGQRWAVLVMHLKTNSEDLATYTEVQPSPSARPCTQMNSSQRGRNEGSSGENPDSPPTNPMMIQDFAKQVVFITWSQPYTSQLTQRRPRDWRPEDRMAGCPAIWS